MIWSLPILRRWYEFIPGAPSPGAPYMSSTKDMNDYFAKFAPDGQLLMATYFPGVT